VLRTPGILENLPERSAKPLTAIDFWEIASEKGLDFNSGFRKFIYHQFK